MADCHGCLHLPSTFPWQRGLRTPLPAAADCRLGASALIGCLHLHLPLAMRPPPPSPSPRLIVVSAPRLEPAGYTFPWRRGRQTPLLPPRLIVVSASRTSCLPPSLGVVADSPSPTCTAADCRFGSSSAQTVASPGVADDESNKWSGHLIAQDEACGFDASDRVGEGRGQPDDPPIDCRVWVGIFSTNFA